MPPSQPATAAWRMRSRRAAGSAHRLPNIPWVTGSMDALFCAKQTAVYPSHRHEPTQSNDIPRSIPIAAPMAILAAGLLEPARPRRTAVPNAASSWVAATSPRSRPAMKRPTRAPGDWARPCTNSNPSASACWRVATRPMPASACACARSSATSWNWKDWPGSSGCCRRPNQRALRREKPD
jgi:hypothetical protein